MSDVKSFRITDELANKIKEITTTLGGNSQQALAAMVNAYEMQASKQVLPTNLAGRAEELDGHLNSINRIFIDLMDAYKNCEGIAKDRYDAQLKAKDAAIEDLKKQLEESKKQAVEEKEKATIEVKDQLNRANKEIIELQKKVVDLQEQLITLNDKQVPKKSRSRQTKNQES